jgi:SAM-dependent methyltransferase
LAAVFGNENEITAAIFNQDLAESKDWQAAPNVRRRVVGSLDELPEASFDYVVGTAILCHDRFMQNLEALYRLLKPGGQILFFEQNLRNPGKSVFPAIGRWCGNAPCQIGIRKTSFRDSARQLGFRDVEVVPYDIIHPLLPEACAQRGAERRIHCGTRTCFAGPLRHVLSLGAETGRPTGSTCS